MKLTVFETKIFNQTDIPGTYRIDTYCDQLFSQVSVENLLDLVGYHKVSLSYFFSFGQDVR